ncbi:hypothetical protein SMSP2_02895 [Limihaloglobus sulfuriphilus]|uniref:DUF4435 domain-containing protein n=1 Tax=Limihaloglobus sulfuriphilus TaxID=1851148 RepID=A0A1Q2MIM1_9BACT|nr:DUF3226 domain-containing protein [Limihaloglobus sulfuriphilus]AQQ72509.1 hypothetical protein SMSP2_02895 [Limihaloglobus sulfuriphilus]
MPIEKDSIKKPNLLYVEGKDAELFFVYALRSLGLNNIQVFSFAGNSKIDVAQLLRTPASEGVEVKRLVIIRDVEVGTREDAIKSIQSKLTDAGLKAPQSEFALTRTDCIEVGFALLPTKDIEGCTLESLCVNMLSDKSAAECVDSFLKCCNKKYCGVFKQEHKNRLYSHLSGTNSYKGMKIGEAAKAGAFDFESEAFKPYKKFLTSINS